MPLRQSNAGELRLVFVRKTRRDRRQKTHRAVRGWNKNNKTLRSERYASGIKQTKCYSPASLISGDYRYGADEINTHLKKYLILSGTSEVNLLSKKAMANCLRPSVAVSADSASTSLATVPYLPHEFTRRKGCRGWKGLFLRSVKNQVKTDCRIFGGQQRQNYPPRLLPDQIINLSLLVERYYYYHWATSPSAPTQPSSNRLD